MKKFGFKPQTKCFQDFLRDVSEDEIVEKEKEPNKSKYELLLNNNPEDVEKWIEYSNTLNEEKQLQILKLGFQKNPQNCEMVREYLFKSSQMWDFNFAKKQYMDLMISNDILHDYISLCQYKMTVFECLFELKSLFSLFLHESEIEALIVQHRISIFLKEAGYPALSFAIFQAQSDLFFFTKSNAEWPSLLEKYKVHWESSNPMFGEIGFTGWSNKQQKRQQPHFEINETEWILREQMLDSQCVLMKPNDDVIDPYGVVLFDDIQKLLLPIHSLDGQQLFFRNLLDVLGLETDPKFAISTPSISLKSIFVLKPDCDEKLLRRCLKQLEGFESIDFYQCYFEKNHDTLHLSFCTLFHHYSRKKVLDLCSQISALDPSDARKWLIFPLTCLLMEDGWSKNEYKFIKNVYSVVFESNIDYNMRYDFQDNSEQLILAFKQVNSISKFATSKDLILATGPFLVELMYRFIFDLKNDLMQHVPENLKKFVLGQQSKFLRLKNINDFTDILKTNESFWSGIVVPLPLIYSSKIRNEAWLYREISALNRQFNEKVFKKRLLLMIKYFPNHPFAWKKLLEIGPNDDDLILKALKSCPWDKKMYLDAAKHKNEREKVYELMEFNQVRVYNKP